MEQQPQGEATPEPGKYRIGTVAQLTGLTADTIRMWERRYATVSPVRTDGGTRLYGDAEVTRLQLMRALTEAGDPIGGIARLDTQALRERLARLADLGGVAASPPAPDGTVRVAVLGATLPEQMRVGAGDLGQLVLAAAGEDPAALAAAGAAEGADVLVADLALLGAQPVETLQRCRDACGARLALVIYEWATRRQLAKLAAADARLVRGPLSVAALRQTVIDLWIVGAVERRREPAAERAPLAPPPAGPVPARRFDDAQVARLREVRSSIDCECPNHLAGLIASLVAFERYSAACESRVPADAALHATLHRGTAEARARMEELLARVCEQDGLAL